MVLLILRVLRLYSGRTRRTGLGPHALILSSASWTSFTDEFAPSQTDSTGSTLVVIPEGCPGTHGREPELLQELKILVADDHELMRRGVRSLLETQSGWKIVGEASDGHELLQKASESKPDIVVLDIGMPQLNGLEAARRLKKALPDVKVLILSMYDSEQVARAVLDAGARGYVAKSDTARDLVLAVEALRRNKTFFTSHVDQLVLQSFLQAGSEQKAPSSERLTSRQREIVQLLAEGKTNKEIATHLSVSVKTVETHRANITKRLHCHSLSDLVIYAIRNNIIQL